MHAIDKKDKGMSMNNWLGRTLAILLGTALAHDIDAARIIPGNNDTESFTFSLGSHARTGNGAALYVGARTQGNAQDFALSAYFDGAKGFIPYAPQKAILNGEDNQTNPLYNAAIVHLDVFGERSIAGRNVLNPIAVTQAQPANIYYVDNVVQREVTCDPCGQEVDEVLTIVEVCATVYSADNVKDATGTEVTREVISLERFQNEAIFAAVKPNDSDDFGDPNSGVAVIQLVHTKDEKTECVETRLVQIDAEPGDPPMPGITRASSLDKTSDVIKIGNDVVSIENIVDMHYSRLLNRLYIALQVQGGADPADGARGVVVGRLVNRKLIFAPIAPDDVFTMADKIVGGTGADTQVSIHKVRTMRTTTGLDYLIVVGQVGAPADTQQSVFAMPLVNMVYSDTLVQEEQGTLANVQLDPENFFSNSTNTQCDTLPQLFLGRAFVTPAILPDQVYTNMSVEAQVGIGDLPNGNITDINIANDVVFVSVAETIDDEKSGIFVSRALFGQNGVIAAWTPWERVAGTTDKVFGFSYLSRLGSFAWLTGTSSLNIRTVKESLWGLGAEDGIANLVEVLSALLPQACGGIQGFFDLPINTPGLFDISLYIATGLNKVVLVESAQLNADDVLCPNTGDFQTDMKEFTDGEITINFPDGNTRVISISGGVLDDLGPIIAAAVGTDDMNDQGYLFVGGACGLAVLAQEDGNGWSTVNALGKFFDGLVDGMRFSTLGDYTFVRKLIFDEGFLYVLTDTRLDRIDVAASDFMTGTLSVVTVATLEDIMQVNDGTLLDVVISNKFAVLAASTGLYRVGDDADIQTAANHDDVDWTSVIIPEGLPVVQQLQAVASNGMPNGLAKSDNGNLYILDAYRGLSFAQENRYTVQSVVGVPIDNDTIVPLPDMKVKDILTAFSRFGAFRSLINFDGTDNFSARNRIQTVSPFVLNRLEELPLSIKDASIVSAIVRSSASGAWLISGDFGLRVNE